jgi:hypothetical protein
MPTGVTRTSRHYRGPFFRWEAEYSEATPGRTAQGGANRREMTVARANRGVPFAFGMIEGGAGRIIERTRSLLTKTSVLLSPSCGLRGAADY